MAWAKADARMDAIHAYLRLKKIKRSLRNEIDDFYDHYWEHRSAWDHNQLFFRLPTALRSRLHNEVYGPAIRALPIFRDKTPRFVSQVAHLLRPRVYAKIDKVFLE